MEATGREDSFLGEDLCRDGRHRIAGRVVHRPKWQSIESAREELRAEAERLLRDWGICVRAIVVDGSLR